MKRSFQLGLVVLAVAFVASLIMAQAPSGSSSLLLLFALAFGYLFFPKAIQSFAMRAVGVSSRSQTLVAFVSSKQYLTILRTAGFFAVSAAVFLLIESFKGG
jgi:hypothetical protein